MPKFKFLFVLILFGWSRLFAQSSLKRCLYINTNDKYILSEKLDVKNGNDLEKGQEFNSLFIWQKDKVIRVIFKYESKIANTRNRNITKIPFLNTIIPAFKRLKIYYRIRKSDHKPYDLCLCKRPGGKFFYSSVDDQKNVYNYRRQFKQNINSWNKTHNPLADKFDWIYVSDGNPEVFVKNQHRKQDYINNLPLVFDSPQHDSLYIIKPYHIDIYRFSPGIASVKPRRYYKLYSTVSLIDDFLESQYKYSLEGFIGKHTLKYLYKATIPYGTEPAINFMSKFGLPAQKNYTKYLETAVVETFVRLDTVPDKKLSSIENATRVKRKNRMDSLEKIERATRDSTLKFYNADCYGHYQFCSECYNNDIPKIERIKRGCPVNLSPVGLMNETNWSYSFSAGKRNYFKAEIGDYRVDTNSYDGEPTFYQDYSVVVFSDSYPIIWLLTSPGVGYWLSNVSGDSRKLTLPDTKTFWLNNKSIGYN